MVDVTWAEFDDGLEFALWIQGFPPVVMSAAAACALRDELEDAIERAVGDADV